MFSDFSSTMESVSLVFEMAGVTIIMVGFAFALVRAGRALFVQKDGKAAYDTMRSIFGKSVLLGLEILVAADLIRTVAVDPTWQNVVVLGLIVLIRTFLSFSLEVEMDGVWPWRRWQLGRPKPAADEPESGG